MANAKLVRLQKNSSPKKCRPSFLRTILFTVTIITLFTLFTSCSKVTTPDQDATPKYLSYNNKAYGFSINYPSWWNTSAEKMDDKWGVTDPNKNAILFISGKLPSGSSLEQLALDSMRQEMQPEAIDDAQLRKVIRFIDAGNVTWYTFAVEYKDKRMESIISGTICRKSQSHINIILVSSDPDFTSLKTEYTNLLQTFKCTE